MKERLRKYLWEDKRFVRKVLPTVCFLAAAFLLGRNLADAVQESRRLTTAQKRPQTLSQENAPALTGHTVDERPQTLSQENDPALTGYTIDERQPDTAKESDRRKADEQFAQTAAQGNTLTEGSQAQGNTLPQGSSLAQIYDGQIWGLLFTENWGLGGFGEAGKIPTGNATVEELKQYNAYFLGDTSEKNIYLTFDCGYENGNTEAILDALKKHNVHATFFVVGHYLESAPDLVKRMVDDA